jgi:hypothetical protein
MYNVERLKLICNVLSNVLSSIIVPLIPVFWPIIARNFEKENNEVIKEKTDKAEIIYTSNILLVMPIVCLLIQISINRSGTPFNIILTILSFLWPTLFIIKLGCEIWSFCRKSLVKSDNRIIGICKKWIICIFSIFVFLLYSVFILYIVHMSYTCITRKIDDLWGYYIYFYLALGFFYLAVRSMIGVYKNKYAEKLEIDYFDKGKYKKLETDYYKLKIQKDYISFYLKDKDKEIKYIVPLQKVYNVKIYYK